MRAEKKLLTSEYVSRLNGSPFFIVAGYQGLKVAHLNELRKRLIQATISSSIGMSMSRPSIENRVFPG